jgi:Tol biopolymer transport system component
VFPFDCSFTFSPFFGRQQAYYIANPSGDFDIFRMSLDDAKTELVYRSKSDEWDPAVSPDGRWLAFASKQKGNWEIIC